MSSGNVAALLDTVGALELAARRVTEPWPDRLSHILGTNAVEDGDREMVAQACQRIRAVANTLRSHAARPRRGTVGKGDDD
jgi:hypothetical protein